MDSITQKQNQILVLSNTSIFPPITGGHLRTTNFARALARQGYQVKVFCFTGRRSDYRLRRKSAETLIEENLSQIIDLNLKRGVLQALFRRLGMPRVWQNFLIHEKNLPPALWEIYEKSNMVLCDFPFFSFAPFLGQEKPIFLLSHNLEHQILRQEERVISQMLSPRIEKVEQEAPQIYDGIFACTQEDVAFFKNSAFRQIPILEIPNGVMAEEYLPRRDRGSELRKSLGIKEHELVILFAGSAYGPNQEAYEELFRFTHDQCDFLQKESIRFLVVGSVVKKAIDLPFLMARSFVEDIKPYYWASDLAINPVQSGSGSNVKMFEAIAAQLPLISTSFGVRGLNLQPEDDYFPLDWQQLPVLLARIKENRNYLSTMAERVFRCYEEQISMDHIVKSKIQPVLLNYQSGRRKT